MQDKARAGGHREGEETVNMKRSGRNHCWIRTVLGLEQGEEKMVTLGRLLYDLELNNEFICIAYFSFEL